MNAVCLIVLSVLGLPFGAHGAAVEWRLVWQDDFQRPALGNDWAIVRGAVAIKDGRLELTGSGGTVLVNRPFKPDVRFEFDAQAAPGAPPCDLSATIGANPVHGYGYLLAFGGQNNRVNQLLGPGLRQVVEKPTLLIEPGRKYHCLAQAEGGRFTYTVDGDVLLDAAAKEPAQGPGFDRIGLVTWNGMWIEHFRVYERAPKHPNTPDYPSALPDCGLRRDGRRLVCAGNRSPALDAAIQSFNTGDLMQAQRQFQAVGGTLGLIGEAYVMGDLDYAEQQIFLAGQTTPDFQRLAERFLNSAKTTPSEPVLAEYAKAAASLPRLIMARDGLVAAVRLTALGPENNPFYHKARLYEARYHYWNGMEGGNPAQKAEALAWMAELKKLWPAQTILRQYTGEAVPWGQELNADTNRHPAWAAYLREAYARNVRIMERFFTRQSPDGQLGGGYGDDCELMRTWMQISAISTATSQTTSRGIERLADGIWHYACKDGFAVGIGDVEHSSEPSADMFPGMVFLRYGEPLWVERNLRACKTIKEHFMATDKKGFPRFLSSEYGADGVNTGLRAGGDTGYNARPMKHFIWQAWWGTPEARDWFVRWADGWRAATMTQIAEKIPGMIPPTLWHPAGDIHPPDGWKWYDPKANYYGCPGLGGMIMDSLLAAAHFTHEPKFLQPLQLQMDYATSGPLYSHKGAPPSAEWQKGFLYDAADPTQLSLYRQLTGERVYDEYILRYGDPAQVYRVTYDLAQFMKSFERAAVSQRHNLELATTEVLSTDRAALGSALTVFGAYTGAITGMRDAATPTFAVTYDTPDLNFAALVTEANPQRLRVWLYSFNDAETKIGLKLWQLVPGRYVLNQGAPMPGERANQNRYGWTAPRTVTLRHRAEVVEINVPLHRESVVDLRLDEPIQVPATAPDLAVGKSDVVLTNGELDVTVHNLGSAAAASFAVALQHLVNGSWQTITEQKVPSLPEAKNFVPSTRKLRFKLVISASHDRLIIDPTDKVYELCEENNAVEITP